MNVCIVENGIISNVIVASDQADPADFGGYLLPDGKWIGDIFQDEIPAPTPEERITALESATGKAIADSDAMNVDQEYRLTLLELGLNE